MSNFQAYSGYYDLLYQDKDYQGEADHIAALIRAAHPSAKTLLDMGCGTGKHAALLRAHGFQVCGMDVSETMLQEARRNHPDIAFHQGDVRDFRLPDRFDAVVSLFHVASYQTSNEDFTAFVRSARSLLAPGGIFLFDFWYGPAVLTTQPSTRVKRLQNDRMKITRIAEPVMHSLRNVVDVNYQVMVEEGGQRHELAESHPMRYFFAPELAYMLASNGMALKTIQAWMTSREPSASDWSVSVVASAG